MTDLFPGYEDYMEGKAAKSARSYEVRWLRKLYNEVYSEGMFIEDKRDAGDEFGFLWFNENYPLPIKLHASKLKDIAPAHILRSQGMTKREFWREYFNYKANYAKGALVGMIFPVSAMQHFIMHNMVGLEGVVGVNRIIRPAANADHSIVIEPADAFITALAKAQAGVK